MTALTHRLRLSAALVTFRKRENNLQMLQTLRVQLAACKVGHWRIPTVAWGDYWHSLFNSHRLSSGNATLAPDRAWAKHGLALLHIVTRCHTQSYHVWTAQTKHCKAKRGNCGDALQHRVTFQPTFQYTVLLSGSIFVKHSKCSSVGIPTY